MASDFPPTAWSRIRHQDLNHLITAYWRPVFYFLRARGYPLHRAEDLTQEFFTRFLERPWLRRADPQRGRFRTFLLTVLKRFLSDQGLGRAPRQQQFEQQLVPIGRLLGKGDRSLEPAGEEPESVYMRQWVAAVVAAALDRLRRQCGTEGHPAWYEVFAASHRADAPARRVRQQALADRFGLTRDQVLYALDQAKRRFGDLLRAEVREQVGAENEVDAEIGDLKAWLG